MKQETLGYILLLISYMGMFSSYMTNLIVLLFRVVSPTHENFLGQHSQIIKFVLFIRNNWHVCYK